MAWRPPATTGTAGNAAFTLAAVRSSHSCSVDRTEKPIRSGAIAFKARRGSVSRLATSESDSIPAAPRLPARDITPKYGNACFCTKQTFIPSIAREGPASYEVHVVGGVGQPPEVVVDGVGPAVRVALPAHVDRRDLFHDLPVARAR